MWASGEGEVHTLYFNNSLHFCWVLCGSSSVIFLWRLNNSTPFHKWWCVLDVAEVICPACLQPSVFNQSACTWPCGTFADGLDNLGFLCWRPLLLDLPGIPCRAACLSLSPSCLLLGSAACILVVLLVSLFQPLWSCVHDFLLLDFSAFDGLSGNCCNPLLPLHLPASQAGVADLCIGYCIRTVWQERLQTNDFKRMINWKTSNEW